MLFTYFRLGKLDKFYLATTNKPFAQEIDFMEAANILETEAKDKLSVGKDFFTLLKKNQDALALALQTDHETVYAPSSNRDTSSKLLANLDYFLRSNQTLDFTEDEELFFKNVITALKNGELAKKTINRVTKEIKKINDSRSILEVLKKNISLSDFVQDEMLIPEKTIRAREVILSEHFI